MKYACIPIDVYDRELHVSIMQREYECTRSLVKSGESAKVVKDIVKASSSKSVSAWAAFHEGVLLIRFHMSIPELRENFGEVVSHEVFHIVNYLLKDIGLPMSDTSEEAYAYLIGYLNKQINKLIWK